MASFKLLATLLAAMCMLLAASAFAPPTTAVARSVAARRAVAPLRSGGEEQQAEEEVADAVEEEEVVDESAPGFGQQGFFQPNANLRYGASRDQDGKSNVWAIEPKMRVEDGEGKGGALATGAIILAACGAIVAFTIANLPSPDTY